MENTISAAPQAHLGAHAARIPEQRPHPRSAPRHERSLLEAALRYVEQYGWEVAQGTWLEETGGAAPRCSCGDGTCAAPGAHPAHPGGAVRATGSAAAVHRLWTGWPTAAILLPTGRTFDTIEVPETAGFLALARTERLGVAPGPVTLTPDGRMSFLVLPGGAARVPHLVRELGWSPGSLDLVARGAGEYVVAPPTRFAARGAVQWVCGPAPALPDAEEVLPALAYACAREARRA